MIPPAQQEFMDTVPIKNQDSTEVNGESENREVAVKVPSVPDVIESLDVIDTAAQSEASRITDEDLDEEFIPEGDEMEVEKRGEEDKSEERNNIEKNGHQVSMVLEDSDELVEKVPMVVQTVKGLMEENNTMTQIPTEFTTEDTTEYSTEDTTEYPPDETNEEDTTEYSTENATEYPPDDTIENTVEYHTDDTIEDTADDTNEEPNEYFTEESTEYPTDDTIKNTAEDTNEYPIEDTADDTNEEPNEYFTEDTTEYPTEDTTEYPTEDTNENVTEEPVLENPILPFGWAMYFTDSGEMYYYHEYLQVSQWELPQEHDEHGHNLLHRAIIEYNVPQMNLLIQMNATWVHQKSHAGETPLFLATRLGHLELFQSMELLFTREELVVERDHQGNVLLHAATQSQTLDMMQYILDSDWIVDVNAQNEEGETALHHAANLNLDCIKLLLEYGAAVNVPDTHGVTPLIKATLSGNIPSLQMLQQYIHSHDQVDDHRLTPTTDKITIKSLQEQLAQAQAQAAEFEVVQEELCQVKDETIVQLQEQLQEVQAQSYWYWEQFNVQKSTAESLALALDTRAQQERQTLQSERLHFQEMETKWQLELERCQYDRDQLQLKLDEQDSAYYAAEYYPEENMENHDWSTSLQNEHHNTGEEYQDLGYNDTEEPSQSQPPVSSDRVNAVWNQFFQNMSLKAAANNDVPEINSNLFNAIFEKNIPLLQDMIDSGVSLDARDEEGRTALHYACMQGFVPGIALLCEYGAEVDRVDYKGIPGLHFAISSNSVASVKLLLEVAANPNFANPKTGDTAAHVAVWHGHVQILKILVQYHVDLQTLNFVHKGPWENVETRSPLRHQLEDLGPTHPLTQTRVYLQQLGKIEEEVYSEQDMASSSDDSSNDSEESDATSGWNHWLVQQASGMFRFSRSQAVEEKSVSTEQDPNPMRACPPTDAELKSLTPPVDVALALAQHQPSNDLTEEGLAIPTDVLLAMNPTDTRLNRYSSSQNPKSSTSPKPVFSRYVDTFNSTNT